MRTQKTLAYLYLSYAIFNHVVEERKETNVFYRRNFFCVRFILYTEEKKEKRLFGRIYIPLKNTKRNQ